MSSSGKSGGGRGSARLPQGPTASGSPSSKKSKGSSGKDPSDKDRNGEGSGKKSSSEQDPSKKQKSKATKPVNTGSTGKAPENRDYKKPGPPGYNGPSSLTSSVDSPGLLALTKYGPLSYEEYEVQLMLYVGMSRHLILHDLSLIWEAGNQRRPCIMPEEARAGYGVLMNDYDGECEGPWVGYIAELEKNRLARGSGWNKLKNLVHERLKIGRDSANYQLGQIGLGLKMTVVIGMFIQELEPTHVAFMLNKIIMANSSKKSLEY